MLNVDLVGAVKFNIQHSTFNTLETWWAQLNSTFNIFHIQHSNWISPSNEKAAGPVM